MQGEADKATQEKAAAAERKAAEKKAAADKKAAEKAEKGKKVGNKRLPGIEGMVGMAETGAAVSAAMPDGDGNAVPHVPKRKKR